MHVEGITEQASVALGGKNHLYYAHHLLGDYLIWYRAQAQDPFADFRDWLRKKTNLEDGQLRQCQTCLDKWTRKHLYKPSS